MAREIAHIASGLEGRVYVDFMRIVRFQTHHQEYTTTESLSLSPLGVEELLNAGLLGTRTEGLDRRLQQLWHASARRRAH